MVIAKKSLNFLLFDLVRQVIFANFFTPALPCKITLALTYRCNLRCRYCKTWTRPEKDELSLDKIKLILGSTDNLRWLHFTGGEIFLREDIKEILDFAIQNRKLAILVFPTNGILTDRILDIVRPLSRKLRGTKLVITCSIDGTKEVHDRLRGMDGAYEKCIETFTKLRDIDGVNAYLGISLSKDNYRQVPFLFSDLQVRIPNFNFNELHFNFLNNSFFYNNTLESPKELINKEIYFFVEKLRKAYKHGGLKGFLENRYFKFMRKYIEEKKSPIKCSALSELCFIDPYGNVYPCINYEVRVGNLESYFYDFINFWKSTSKTRNAIRGIIQDKNCPGCWTPCEAYPSILHNFAAFR